MTNHKGRGIIKCNFDREAFMTALYIALGVLGGALILVLLSAFVCFYMTFYSKTRDKRKLAELRLPEGKAYLPFRDEMFAWIKKARAMPYTEMEIRSYDGLTLRGRYYEKKAGLPIELQFHGYRGDSDRDLSGAIVRAFAVDRNALIIDHRASGKSDGHVITFGVKETRDCLFWIDHAIRYFGEDVKLHLTGISMGAATVLMASGEALPPQVRGVLADCPYSSAREIIKKVIREMGLPASLLYPFVRLGARLFGGFDPNDAEPIKAVARAKVPIILYHGDADGFVPSEMSERLFAACASEKKRLIKVKGADHGLAFSVDKENYLKTLNEFIDENGMR